MYIKRIYYRWHIFIQNPRLKEVKLHSVYTNYSKAKKHFNAIKTCISRGSFTEAQLYHRPTSAVLNHMIYQVVYQG